MSIAERIYETVKNMPEAQAADVLDFAEYVKAKHPAQPAAPKPEPSAALMAELQAMVESQLPQTESAGEFIRKMRDGARY